jgi:hypothetical protein
MAKINKKVFVVAIQFNRIDEVKDLLSKGADPNIKMPNDI